MKAQHPVTSCCQDEGFVCCNLSHRAVRHGDVDPFDDDEPVFEPDGKYLFYRSSREFIPLYSDLDDTWIYPNTTRLVAAPLRKDVPSPLAPRNDDEGEKKEKKEKDKDKDKDKTPEKKKPADSPKKEDFSRSITQHWIIASE